MGRSPCCSKVGLRRGPWSTNEDTLLTNFIQEHGEGQWKSLPNKAGLLRCGKSCRLRWMNYLRPGIKRGNISQDEEDLIVRLHRLLGNRWSLIAGRLPGRTDNEIKNHWNTYLLKKLNNNNIAPMHKTSHLPKPPKSNKSKKSAAKKKTMHKKLVTNNKTNIITSCEEHINMSSSPVNTTQIILPSNPNFNNDIINDPPKTKVYMPKAIRVVSSVFSRTESYDSLVSRTSSSNGGESAEENAAMEWPPLSELMDANYGCGGEEEDFLVHHLEYSMSSDVNMWEQVYDEYLQLLYV